MLHEAITFDSYAKITDTLCYLGSRCMLNFVVSLGYEDKKGVRSSPVVEYLKKATTFSNARNDKVYVKRNYRGYLAFEYRDPAIGLAKNTVFIYERDMIGLRDVIKKFNSSLKEAFATKNNKLLLTTKAASMNYKNPAYGNEILRFTPVILNPNGEDGVASAVAGVNITFNASVGIDITMERWAEVLYIILSVNIPIMAMTLVSGYTSATMGKNIIDIDNFNNVQQREIVDKETMEEIDNANNSSKAKNSNNMNKFFLNP